jgi:adenylate cyclase
VTPRVTFEGDERAIDVPVGTSLLKAGLDAGLAVTHACGGQGKCSTCRVVVLEGLAHAPARNDAERVIADRRGFAPEVRLSCQTPVVADALVRFLVRDDEDYALVREEVAEGAPPGVGEERRVAILFCDVRDFTGFAEAHAPYDVIHVLNRHFRRVHAAVEAEGGRIDNFMGDGVMALFGLDDRPERAWRALRAGSRILADAQALSPWFEAQFHRPFRVGVGVHVGDVVVGAVGAGDRRRVTAIGDPVNLAARVEAANRDAGTSFLATDDAIEAAGASRVRTGRRVDVELKGKTGVHRLWEVKGLGEAEGVS